MNCQDKAENEIIAANNKVEREQKIENCQEELIAGGDESMPIILDDFKGQNR